MKDDEGWFGTKFPEGVDELYFVVVGVIKDIERLALLYELFTETLDELCRMGAAVDTPPNVTGEVGVRRYRAPAWGSPDLR